MKSAPILKVYKGSFLLYRHCYMDNLLIGKIKEYMEENLKCIHKYINKEKWNKGKCHVSK